MGLRERKKADTRAALSWAALRLTVERGFDHVRIDDIAEAAGVSPRTFNNYFSSKGEAIAARHLDRLVGVADALRDNADRPLWDAITDAVVRQFEPDAPSLSDPPADAARWASGVRVMLAEPALQGELLRAVSRSEVAIAAVVAERTGTDPDRDLYPHLVAGAVTAATQAAMRLHLQLDSPPPLRQLLTEAFSGIAAGLPTP